MEIVRDRKPNQFAPPSLIEFLLGDGIHPGWLDKYSRTQSSSANWCHETSALR
jgi:hypothetical protein